MIDLSNIETIVFDLGGVLVNLDLDNTIKAFEDMGIDRPDRFIQPGLHSDIFLKLELGEISEEEFYSGIRELAGRDIPDKAIRNAWCALLTDFPEVRVRIIEKLKNNHRVILLSNTNSIHLNYFDGMADGYKSLSELFHKVYYSFLLHDHKPNISVFKKIIELENLVPDKTLFVDDAQKNILSAGEAGMQTLLITPEKQMEDIFDPLPGNDQY